MTRLEFLKNYGSIGVECGVISPDVFMKFVRYTDFVGLIKEGKSKKSAIEETLERHKLISELTIYRDIKFFQDGEKTKP